VDGIKVLALSLTFPFLAGPVKNFQIESQRSGPDFDEESAKNH
jgi:hypothetical protein